MSGASAPSLIKEYFAGSQITLPDAPLMTVDGRGAMKPLCASSKDVLSLNGSSLSSALLAVLVASEAGFGFSASAAIAWVASAMAAKSEQRVPATLKGRQ
ncbi:hypothetical protein D3C76_1710120 [compost metagenome]